MNSRKKMAKLRVRLKGFVKPSTKSQVEGFLEPGNYIVEDYLKNQQPDDDTDYALVQAPTLGAGDTWILYAVEESALRGHRRVAEVGG